LPFDLFRGLTNLRRINLANNKLTYLHPDLLSGLNLNSIIFEFNLLTE
jgi:hypothetical protein